MATGTGDDDGCGHVPLSFAPGEAYQFDWSHEIVLINGTTVSMRVAHVRLCDSQMLFVRAHSRETQEMVFDAHDRTFTFFKGCCTPAHEIPDRPAQLGYLLEGIDWRHPQRTWRPDASG